MPFNPDFEEWQPYSVALDSAVIAASLPLKHLIAKNDGTRNRLWSPWLLDTAVTVVGHLILIISASRCRSGLTMSGVAMSPRSPSCSSYTTDDGGGASWLRQRIHVSKMTTPRV
jgi:hypothetical protein